MEMLIYNGVLVSQTMLLVYSKVIQLYEYKHTYIISQIIFHYRLLQDTEYSSLSCRIGPCCLSMLYKLKDTCSLEGKLLQT